MNNEIFNFFFVITIASIIFSCSKDDSQDVLVDSLIVGEWKATNIIVNGSVTHQDLWGPITENVVMDAINENNFEVQIFRSPNEMEASGSFGITISGYLGSGRAYQNISHNMFFNPGSWTIESNVLLVSSDNDPQRFFIRSVDDSKLVLSKKINFEMVDIYNTLGEVELTLTIFFKKN